MTESVQITFRLRGVMRREGRQWVAGYPKLDLWSQGPTKADAQRCLEEALELWVEDCLARGTLDQALREVGFQPAPWGTRLTGREESVLVVSRRAADTVVGSEIALELKIPGYQAATLLETSSPQLKLPGRS
jgi:predicted RNase H-like HicB family nuclease